MHVDFRDSESSQHLPEAEKFGQAGRPLSGTVHQHFHTGDPFIPMIFVHLKYDGVSDYIHGL